MSRRAELIRRHINRLVDLARSAHLKRVLTSVEREPSLNFWRVIYGNLLDVAVLEWCKIFGTDDQPTHWKKIVCASDQAAFRKNLLVALKIDESAWSAYWREMQNYRNEHVAHHVVPSNVSRYPMLDIALASSYFYYKYLVGELRKLDDVSKFPSDLESYCERFAALAKEAATKALTATSGMLETVR